jgi:hypothetical protein
MAFAPQAMVAGAAGARGIRDVEAAVIGHGKVQGPYVEIDDFAIERDERFPVRVTVQFYKATSNGVVSAQDMEGIAAQIDEAGRIRLLEEAAQVARDVANQPEKAISYLQQLLLRRPEDRQLAVDLRVAHFGDRTAVRSVRSVPSLAGTSRSRTMPCCWRWAM